jgi:acetyl esterase
VLHDDGAGYADLLRSAGVPVTHVTYSAAIHDFVMVNSMHDTFAARAAVAQACAFLAAALA